MTVWLTPIDSTAPFLIGAGRFPCEPASELEPWRAQLRELHPRLLPLFKASLLSGDPYPSASAADSAACGLERIPFALAEPGPIRFDGPGFGLSACGEAMVERLLAPEEALRLLERLEPAGGSAVRWTEAMREWLHSGKPVILLREDT